MANLYPLLPITKKPSSKYQINCDLQVIEDQHNRAFVSKCLAVIPASFMKKVLSEYGKHLENDSSYFNANVYIRKLSEFSRTFPFNLTFTDHEILVLAKEQSLSCYKVSISAIQKGYDILRTVRHVEVIVKRFKLNISKSKIILSNIRRYCCELWWRKKLAKVHRKSVEKFASKMGLIHKKSQKYLSDFNFQKGISNKNANKAFIEVMELYNEDDEVIDLKTALESSTANPVNRRNELMTRICGAELYGEKHLYEALFLTVTCPSSMHSMHISGLHNQSYESISPDMAHKYLCKMWQKVRAKLNRLSIPYFGVRVAEPHHDGTPHWHLLIFVSPTHQNQLINVYRQYALEVNPGEKGADKYRFKVKKIDKSKGTAVGYVAKYISKNIDGYGLNNQEESQQESSANRATEWACLWGIRQFQFFGMPPVTIWRELRRLNLTGKTASIPAFIAADKGDWLGYIEALGGINIQLKLLPIKLVKIYNSSLGRYLEPIGYQIKGLSINDQVYISRPHKWKVRKKLAIKNDLSPWSSGNNCTELLLNQVNG